MPLKALFVHGMGRSPLSAYPVLRRLRHEGVDTMTFGYTATLESFDGIVRRLAARIARVAGSGDYILIGHSLGGVMIRAALGDDQLSRLPSRVFLLGSPIQPARLAKSLGRNLAYRIFTGDCGQLLGSEERMMTIGSVPVPTTAIVGTRGWRQGSSTFGHEVNDGVLALNEVSAGWITDEVRLPIAHTFLPSSGRVAKVILDRILPAGLKR